MIKESDVNEFDQIRPKLIKYFQKEYECYEKYLPKDFFFNELLILEKEYNKDCKICPEILFKILIKNSILRELSQQIKQGDIDLEIDLIDKYTPLINRIISKMKLKDINIDNESILIKAIESYDGKIIFSLHLISIIRNKLNAKENNKLKQSYQDMNKDSSVQENICLNEHNDTLVNSTSDEQISDLEESKEGITNIKDTESKIEKSNRSNKKSGNMNNLQKYLGVSEEKLTKAISQLDEMEIDLLHKYYGADLLHPVLNNIGYVEKNIIKINIIPRIERILAGKKIRKISKSLEKKLSLINAKENTNKINQVTERSESKLEKEISANDSEEKLKPVTETKKLEEKLEIKTEIKNEEETNDYMQIIDILQKNEFKEITKNKPANEFLIVSLKFGYFQDKCFSTDEIADFLDVDKEYVIDVTKKVLTSYKQRLNQMIDEVITTNKEDIKQPYIKLKK